jgi:hypothetical protein
MPAANHCCFAPPSTVTDGRSEQAGKVIVMAFSPAVAKPAATTVALLVPLAVLDRRMQKTGGPGIIPFELAGPERSGQILRRWGPEGRRAATLSLLLDFPFLASYTALNIKLTRRAQKALGGQGLLYRVASAAQVMAGACDAVENTALLVVISRNGDEGMARLAQVAAGVKFAGLGVGWLFGAGAVIAIRRA